MQATAEHPHEATTGERRGWLSTAASRTWAAVLAVWAAITGLAPHVLHHVGPLAGAALIAGATGKLLFGAIGLIAAIPFLLRLRRRFATWKAPAIALTIFIAMFSVSTFVIGPLISESNTNNEPGIQQPNSHASHHR